jgi:N-acetylmuramoyl-L-alanine amidase
MIRSPGGLLTKLIGRAAQLTAALCLLAFLSVPPGPAAAEPLRAAGFTMSSAGDGTRVELGFNSGFDPGWFLLRAPYRLVIDLPDTAFAIEPDSTRASGLVSIVRYGHFDKDHARLILGGDKPFSVRSLSVVAAEPGSATSHRLVIDLASASPAEFDAQLAERSGLQAKNRVTLKGDRVAERVDPGPARPFTIVIDPGHGGIDGGARGVSGIEEKTITLAFALELKKKLETIENIRIIMTRDADLFLRLSERVRIARQHEADLFISIHADTIRYRNVRGATVYTVSAKASDAMAEEIAASENLADRVAGLVVEEVSHEVSDILLDLLRRETQTFSIGFARSLVGEMSHTVEMIKNPHRSAGFQVLTAPDVPSVLVELGYLSNPKDEALMRDPQWRDRASDSIVAAVKKFAQARSAGTGG